MTSLQNNLTEYRNICWDILMTITECITKIYIKIKCVIEISLNIHDAIIQWFDSVWHFYRKLLMSNWVCPTEKSGYPLIEILIKFVIRCNNNNTIIWKPIDTFTKNNFFSSEKYSN